jgi:hypothetical protein
LATSDEIDALKVEWQRDPSYNIEDAVGFEEHRNELYLWRLIYETDCEKLERDALQGRADAEGRSAEVQEAIEGAQREEGRCREAAARSLQRLFDGARLRWFGSLPLSDAIDAIVDDIVRAAEARVESSRLSESHNKTL